MTVKRFALQLCAVLMVLSGCGGGGSDGGSTGTRGTADHVPTVEHYRSGGAKRQLRGHRHRHGAPELPVAPGCFRHRRCDERLLRHPRHDAGRQRGDVLGRGIERRRQHRQQRRNALGDRDLGRASDRHATVERHGSCRGLGQLRRRGQRNGPDRLPMATRRHGCQRRVNRIGRVCRCRRERDANKHADPGKPSARVQWRAGVGRREQRGGQRHQRQRQYRRDRGARGPVVQRPRSDGMVLGQPAAPG